MIRPACIECGQRRWQNYRHGRCGTCYQRGYMRRWLENPENRAKHNACRRAYYRRQRRFAA